MLYTSWRNETTDRLQDCETYQDRFEVVKGENKQNRKQYENHTDVLDQAVQDIESEECGNIAAPNAQYSGAASSISEGAIFIYSCSGQLSSFEIKSISKELLSSFEIDLISKELNCPEHEYMNMAPSLIELAAPLAQYRDEQDKEIGSKFSDLYGCFDPGKDKQHAEYDLI